MEQTDMTRLIRTARAGTAWRYLMAAVIAGALAVAGCSAGSGPSTHGGSQAKVTLTFKLTGAPASHAKPEKLTCDPVGGNQPGAASECTKLLKSKKNPFAPIAKGINCPMLLRSNKKILVTGTWFGITVHRVVVDGGCDTALFDSLHKIIH
jgi:hypothetical protein